VSLVNALMHFVSSRALHPVSPNLNMPLWWKKKTQYVIFIRSYLALQIEAISVGTRWRSQ
jgi:hypothetical protein